MLVFGLAALLTGGVYLGLTRSLSDEPVSRTFNLTRVVRTPQGVVEVPQGTVRAEIQGLEAEVNDRALDELRRWSLLALTAGAVASLGVGWLVAGRVLRPVDRITGVARDIQATDLSRRIALDGPDDELKELADTFDGMLGRLDEAFEGQRHFIQEASHELRNPLAVIRTNLDVALADEGASAEELRTAAEVVGRTAERMSHLVDDLLRYARNEQAVMARAGSTSASSSPRRPTSSARRPRPGRCTSMRRCPRGRSSSSGDRVGLRQAAGQPAGQRRAAGPGGSTIRVGAGLDGPWSWIAVGDEGPGITPRTNRWCSSASGGEPPSTGPRGSGLGLAIVDQILVAHGGAARVVSEPGRGSVFSLWIPRHPVEVDAADG